MLVDGLCLLHAANKLDIVFCETECVEDDLAVFVFAFDECIRSPRFNIEDLQVLFFEEFEFHRLLVGEFTFEEMALVIVGVSTVAFLAPCPQFVFAAHSMSYETLARDFRHV